MNEQQDIGQDWRANITDPKPTFKLADKEVATIKFLTEGILNPNLANGPAVIFEIIKITNSDTLEGDELNWFINPKNYSLLGQIKDLGEHIKDKVVQVKREGTTKADTRYTLTSAKES